ncbi:MAG TPA: CHAT domain-containing protein [Allosphingosinicella sp.]
MTIRRRIRLAAAFAAAFAAAASAAVQPISRQDSFAIGSGAGILCTAQAMGRDPALTGMFDRGYAIACRDASVPVGRLYALRVRGGDPAARLAALRAGKISCEPSVRAELDGLAGVDSSLCTLAAGDVGYRIYARRSGNTLYVAEGLAGYDSALRLGLLTIVTDRPVDGEVSIATTGAGDPVAFARAQAGSLDPGRAMAEAYRRNNEGSFAESAEFFESLILSDPNGAGRGEALINQALQHSNLGRAEEAAALFGQAEALVGNDPVLARMLRNYRAIHLMNQGRESAALDALARPLPEGAELLRPAPASAAVDAAMAARLNADPPAARGLRSAASALLPVERARIFDAQALHLRGALLRRAGRGADSEAALVRAARELAAVREGRVVSTLWLRAQIHGELAAIAEERKDSAAAGREHDSAIALLQGAYPDSPALLGARARRAAWLARAGRTAEALAGFREIVDEAAARGQATPGLRRALAPYFALLIRESARPGSVADLFKASQLLLRPGVAQTQAVLARELSGGNDEASRLFRQSVDLVRDIERVRVETSRLASLPALPEADSARLAALRALLPGLEASQVATQSKLAAFPRYRVVASGAMPLSELQQLLRPGEAYYKMIVAGGDAYAIFATASEARAFRIGARPSELERDVDRLRATVAVEQEGRVLTYPFDVALAHRLYGQLFDPVAAEMAAVRHLIFEPDGAMLRLPPNLLVAGRAGVDSYLARAARPGDEGFDFTGVEWLGRDRDVSTAVSALAFRDVRRIAPSRASKNYLGFGENRVPENRAVVRNALDTLLGENPACAFPLTQWARPISASELVVAEGVIERQEGPSGSQIVTGDAFSDSAIRTRADLRDYRILHFATHGLVTAPRPECPARPALMTSFGGPGSDGLLSFSEIYDLRIDADLVILSACDTAGKASLAATREAGLGSGGDFALDGLVRAFIGAGGRSVIASHWPVPDDYDSTKRLISGLFTAPPGTTTASALRAAQQRLMDSPATSHPYYWAGFAIIGDGAAPVLPSK